MKYLKILLVILVFPSFSIAQSFSGVATYKSSTKFDLKLDSTRIPPERIKEIKARMRQALFKEYTLTFNQSESVFKEVEQLEQGDPRGARFMAMFTGGGGQVYKNVQTKYQLEQSEFFGKIFLITDSLDLPKWSLGKETKQIGSYTCYKATTTRQAITRIIKTGTEESSRTDTLDIEITAWYTPQIPISNGPDVYWGLPGMIMEVGNGQTTFLCTRMELKKEDVDIDEPKKGDEVNRSQYVQIVEEKMIEMEKMRGQGGPDGRGGGGRGPMGNNTFEIKISR